MRESVGRLAPGPSGAGRPWIDDWNRFWFTPQLPHTLAAIRVLAGGMLFYTHWVWGLELAAFLGRDGWLPSQLARQLSAQGYTWSYLWWIESPVLLWCVHVLALLIFALLTVGCWTRVVSILAWLITLAYCHRLRGAFFGLDQVNAMLAMYLTLGASGAAYSVDRWRAARAGQGEAGPTVGTNLAIRLIQVHLCVIYLFGGISKMRGQMWWDGSAIWYAVANLEYQSLDLTWLVHFPWLVSLLSHLTVFWETSYCALVWPRRTRPIVLAVAVAVHGGIALALGMITFGLAMLIANLSFLPSALVRDVVRACSRRHLSSTAPSSPVVEPDVQRPRRRGGERADRLSAVARR
jgi:hypothetical protein